MKKIRILPLAIFAIAAMTTGLISLTPRIGNTMDPATAGANAGANAGNQAFQDNLPPEEPEEEEQSSCG